MFKRFISFLIAFFMAINSSLPELLNLGKLPLENKIDMSKFIKTVKAGPAGPAFALLSQ